MTDIYGNRSHSDVSLSNLLEETDQTSSLQPHTSETFAISQTHASSTSHDDRGHSLQNPSTHNDVEPQSKLVPSRAEFLRSNPSPSVDRSAEALFPTINDRIIGSSDPIERQPTGSSTASHTPIQQETCQPGASDQTRSFLKSRFPSWGRKSRTSETSINGMQIFDREVGDDVKTRFRDIQEHLEPSLVKFLQGKRVQFRPLSLQILVLGESEESAQPWIVVNCPNKAVRHVEGFLQQAVIKRIYHGPSSCRVRFQAVAAGHFRAAHNGVADEVFIERDNQEYDQSTWPRQIKVLRSGEPNYAMLGGFVEIHDSHGTTSCFGLTVGHVLPENTFESGDEDHSEDDCDDDIMCDMENEDATDDQLGKYETRPLNWNRSSAFWRPSSSENFHGPVSEQIKLDRSWQTLGSMIEASYSDRARNRDWALIKVNSPCEKEFNARRRSVKGTIEPSRPFINQMAQIGDHTNLQCRISALPARALLPSGYEFVDVNVIRLVEKKGVPEGSSGSWVVHIEQTNSIKVFGTLVATDARGDLWMVPIEDTLKDIRDELGAAQAVLKDCTTTSSIASDTAAESADECRDLSDASEQSKTLRLDQSHSVTMDQFDLPTALQSYSFEQAKGQAPDATMDLEDRTTDLKHGESNTDHDTDNSARAEGNQVDQVPYGYGYGYGKDQKFMVWYCSECGDGPRGEWQPSCQSCGHSRCANCEQEAAR